MLSAARDLHLLIIVAALMLIPFLWMLSASFKLNKDVFTFPH